MTLPVMTSTDLLERIAAGESQSLEFKASFDKTSIETLVAFANTQGGTVLVGVSNAAIVRGVTVGKETLNEWLGQIKSATSPSLVPELVAHRINGKVVVSIEVAEFPVKPVSTRGRYYKRIASSNHALALNEIADLYLLSLQISWDAHTAPQASVADLAPSKVERFIQRVNASGRFELDGSTPLAALEKLNYLVQGQPTWAAMLLFAAEPLRHHIHIGRFKTPSTIIDDRQFTDTLFEVVEQAMTFIVSHISVAFEFDGSIQRKERFAYPLPAIKEALLNAVVHRSYTDPNDIQIKIFDDKITIFSPGTFYGGLTVADIQADNYRSSLRNKLIAEGFYLINVIEKYGSGFIRIRSALKDYPEVDFDVKEFQGGVMATFTLSRPASPPPKVVDITEGVTTIEQTPEKSSEKSSEKILHHLKGDPNLSAQALAEKLGISSRAVEKQINLLKKEGRLSRIGPAKGGYWKVVE
ncbi:MAG: ATP-binding protein [Sulfuritalea sp.]|nr:ATP-binding protein [Sulfuritalea sp.]